MTQTEQIKNYLEQGDSITPLKALNLFGCFRLGARIYDLKQSGMKIKTEIITKNNKRFAKYTKS